MNRFTGLLRRCNRATSASSVGRPTPAKVLLTVWCDSGDGRMARDQVLAAARHHTEVELTILDGP